MVNKQSVCRSFWSATTVVVSVLASLAVCFTASAAQTFDIRENDTTIVRVSIRDQTRLRVAEGRIFDVIGDVYDSASNPTGRVKLLKVEEDGDVYVKPVDAIPGQQQAPIKLDVRTDRGTVGLLLQPVDVIGETITLRVQGSPKTASGVVPKSGSQTRAIKALLLALATPGGDSVLGAPQPRVREIPLWKEARFVQRSQLDVSGLVGETYDLTNISGETMVIDERELYKKGVVAISVRSLALQPGASTPVWIIRSSGKE